MAPLLDYLGSLLNLQPGSVGELVAVLLVLLVVWVLKRLRENGNGRGLASLFKLVWRLSRDFGILVETIDGLFQDLSRSDQTIKRLERQLDAAGQASHRDGDEASLYKNKRQRDDEEDFE